MFLIFRTELQAHPDCAGLSIALTHEERQHMRARRLVQGSDLLVGDGKSRHFKAGLKDSCAIIERLEEMRLEPERLLLSAIPEAKRRDWLLQKATELGATRIVPLLSERSGPWRMEARRSHRIIYEAACQSGRFFLPELEREVSLLDLCQQLKAGTFRAAGPLLLLHPQAKESFSWQVRSGAAGIVVGPEGGFSQREVKSLEEAGCMPVRLGNAILRVETAALAGLALLAVHSQ